MRRVLVTGAAGFVGRHALAALGAALDPGDRLVAATFGGETPHGDAVALDISDRAATDAALRDLRPTHILHLAARSSVRDSADAAPETWQVNLAGTLNLARAVASFAPEATLLFASSSEVYGRAFLAGRPLDETAVPQPANPYARTKLAAEWLLDDVLPGTARLILVRPFNHTGAGQDERFVLPSFAGQIARIEAGLAPPVIEVGDLSASRDFLDVRDVVAAYRALILGSDALPARSLFNVASGTARRIGDMLDELRMAADRPIEVRVAAERLRRSEIPLACGASGRLREAIGWRPAVPWSDTVASLMADARRRASRAP